jgi:sugar lactone lactonase YvrE
MAVSRPEAELVSDVHARLGEGPVWDADRGILWWVDILGGTVHGFDPHEESDRKTEVGEAVSAVVLRRDGLLFVFGESAILTFDPSTGLLSTSLQFPVEMPARRSNDAKADPSGCVWLGRMTWDHAPGTGDLFRLDPDMSITPVLTGLAIPNGMDWTADGRTMYFAESPSRTVTAYDFDAGNGKATCGSPSAGRPFLRVGPELGLPDAAVPDGLTLDAEGFMWLATWGGRSVVRISPSGRLVDRIDVPASQVSSCAFGGPDLADLYITTAREDFTPADNEREPHAGGLFRARPAVGGVLPRRSF